MCKRLLSALGAMLCSAWLPVMGQTLFTVPDTTPNYAQYRYPDECISAVNRLTAEVNSKDTVWRDTASIQHNLLPLVQPVIALEVAKICFGQVNADTISASNALNWAEYLLAAKREPEAEKLFVRAIDATPFGELVTRLQEIARIYQRRNGLGAQTAADLLDLYRYLGIRVPDDSLVMAMYLRQTAMLNARSNGDFATAERLEKEFKSLLDRIQPKAIWSKHSYTATKKTFGVESLREIFSKESEDSLAISTAAYRNHLVHVWKKYVDDDAKETDVVEGLRAPNIKGSWYYTNGFTIAGGKVQLGSKYAKSSQVERPASGKINAIAFLNGDCHPRAWTYQYGRNKDGNINCWPIISSLRRLKERYPDLEITVVSKTFGNYANGAPLAPQEEADTLASYFLGFHQIPGVNVVVEGEFINVDGLDRRRVDIDAGFEYDYDFADIFGNKILQSGTVLLIDEAGYLFHWDGIVGYNELIAQKKIGIVQKRIDATRRTTSSH